MNITINGETREIQEGTTIQALLEALELQPDVTVVQRNEDIIQRDAYEATALNNGDTLELVRFVGGG